jgi:hypothetical protein
VVVRARPVLIYVGVFVVLAIVLFAGALALNSYNVSHAPSSSSVPSLFVGSTIRAKEAAETDKGSVYRFYFSKESGNLLRDGDLSGRILEVDKDTYDHYVVGDEYWGPVGH